MVITLSTKCDVNVTYIYPLMFIKMFIKMLK